MVTQITVLGIHFLGCCNKLPQAGCQKQQTFIPSQLVARSLKARSPQDQAPLHRLSERVRSWWPGVQFLVAISISWFVATSLSASSPHVPSLCLCVKSFASPLQGYMGLRLGPNDNSACSPHLKILNLTTSTSPFFQIREHLQACYGLNVIPPTPQIHRSKS